MIKTCKRCNSTFNDEFRMTTCPHNAFPANDGNNNFRVHDESPLIKGATTATSCTVDETEECQSCQ